MSAIKLSTCATVAAAVAAAGFSTTSNPSYADASSWFNPFSSRSPPENDAKSDKKSSPAAPASDSADEEPTGRSSAFDHKALEEAAKALRKLNNSPHSRELHASMRNQEKTRLAEVELDKAMMAVHLTKQDIERQQSMAEEQRQLVHEQSQVLAQVKRQEEELAKKRMQQDHETQRRNNVDLVKMQEESFLRQEQARQKTEEQIQAQQRQTEKERAKIEQETLRVKAMAEAEARAHEAKLTEDQNRRMLIDRLDGEKQKWLAAINTTFGHIEGGLKELLNDRRKLFMTVGGVTALAAGVYTTREGARVSWGYINRILGQPSLIRESSMSRFPWSALASRRKQNLFSYSTAGATKGSPVRSGFENVILHPSLQRRIEQLARATANTKAHQAPFRNMLFYGPPGTGKTLVAREIARKSGLDYAMMTGGDVAPLGPQAVTKIHEIFDWAKNSKKGLLLFIDEADAFLCERNSTYMSEAQRSALNALLFRTGDQSRDIVLVLATNRPGDLDSAVTDRIDDVIEFPLPGEEERYKLLNLYLNKYMLNENRDDPKSKWGPIFKIRKKPQSITIKDLSEGVLREAARKTEGFSGREIAKLMASVQAAVYGRPDCVLDSQLFKEIVDYKVSEHHQRIKLATEGVQPA